MKFMVRPDGMGMLHLDASESYNFAHDYPRGDYRAFRPVVRAELRYELERLGKRSGVIVDSQGAIVGRIATKSRARGQARTKQIGVLGPVRRGGKIDLYGQFFEGKGPKNPAYLAEQMLKGK